MYPVIGLYTKLKLWAKSLIHRAYEDSLLLHLTAAIISLGVASQLAYEYRTQHTCIRLTSGLLAGLINYWYIIPFLLIYVFPIIKQLIESWNLIIDTFLNRILRPITTKFRQLLPSIWTFPPTETSWPMESIRLILWLGSIGPALYLGYKTYSYLFFGISFNLCIAIGVSILVITTLWPILDGIHRDLSPFVFAIIIQHYIMPMESSLNIPLTLLLTLFLFPYLNNLLTSGWYINLIQAIKLLIFQAFVEENQNYKQFFTEFVNLFITIYLNYSVLIICLTSKVSSLLTISILGFLPIHLYTHLIHLILIQANIIMFLFTSFLFGQFILNRQSDDHFIYRFFLSIMILTFYFALLYPLLYDLLRELMIESADYIGLKLKSFRQRIYQKGSQFSQRYLHITYIDDPSKLFILHLYNAIISVCLLTIIPINILFRPIFSLLSYLLLGRLLLTRGIEILGVLVSLCTSIAAGAHVYARYDKSLLLTMSMALITYISTIVIAFPMIYRFVQFLFIHIPLMKYLDNYLQKSFTFVWSYFDIFWLRICSSFIEIKTQIEQSRLNIFQRTTNPI